MKITSPCSFNLNLSYYEWHWACFHIFKKILVFSLLGTICSYPLPIFPLGCWSSVFYNKVIYRRKSLYWKHKPFVVWVANNFLNLSFALWLCLLHQLFVCVYLWVWVCKKHSKNIWAWNNNYLLMMFQSGLSWDSSLFQEVSAGLLHTFKVNQWLMGSRTGLVVDWLSVAVMEVTSHPAG